MLKFVFALAAILFLSAWSFTWWRGWLFVAVFGTSILAITVYLIRYDPHLLARRMAAGPQAEKEASQKRIQTAMSLLFFLFILFPGFDHRFGWSSVTAAVVIFGEFLVVIAMTTIFLVFRQNTFASAIVDIHAGQHVIDTGLYALVRHPMYLGAVILVIGVPLALGSWWGLLFLPLAVALFGWRLIEEERLLVTGLPGYSAYRKRVRYRLLPFLW